MNVKLFRILKGLSQEELAILAGVAPTTIIRIEQGNGDKIWLSTMKKIAVALETSVSKLFLEDLEF